jgi:hypothetical protein
MKRHNARKATIGALLESSDVHLHRARGYIYGEMGDPIAGTMPLLDAVTKLREALVLIHQELAERGLP